MAITLLHGCFHIELAVTDIEATRQYLARVLGAAPIEQRLAEDLRGVLPPGYDIDHVDLAQATLQYNAPAALEPGAERIGIHQRYLRDVGPCITNLNFYVDDVAHARELLTGLGAELWMSGPSTLVPSLSEYGENSRPGASDRPYTFLGSRSLIGIDLELLEPNFVRFQEQDSQEPCFMGERTGSDAEGLRLERLVIVVPDLDAAYANIVEIFTPGSRSVPYAVREGSSGRAFRLTLSGIELELCQPTSDAGPLAEHLRQFGPGVVRAEIGARDVEPVLERARAETAVAVVEAPDLLGDADDRSRWQLASRSLVGFDILLEHAPDRALVAS